MSESSDFVVDLEGFEGPLDLLLDLARQQKIDLASISMTALADQYLAYLEAMRARDITIAAHYLVMAAWLTYLKTQALLPAEERDAAEAPELAEVLAQRLQRLELMRKAAARLLERPQLGRERLPRGMAEGLKIERTARWRVTLGELLIARARIDARRRTTTVRYEPRDLLSVEAALQRLSQLLTGEDWHKLESFLPAGLRHGLQQRSALASSLMAGLELARRGELEIAQAYPFGPLHVRRVS